MRVAFGREVGGLAGEHAGIQGRVHDVASVIDEQQLASEPARETPDRRLLGEPGQESCGRPLEEVGVVSVRHRRSHPLLRRTRADVEPERQVARAGVKGARLAIHMAVIRRARSGCPS